MEYQENNKRTTTTMTTAGCTSSSSTSSSSTRVRARTREESADQAMLAMCVNSLRQDYMAVLGRPMPSFTERQLTRDLELGTPSIYYQYAMSEAANAPMPSWRYVLAIVARLKQQRIPEEDLLWL